MNVRFQGDGVRMRIRQNGRKMETSERELVRRLCDCLLASALRDAADRDLLLSSLQPPSKRALLGEGGRASDILRLVHLAYDVLLLRKWTWFGSWSSTPLSPLCWCLAYGYHYQVQGRSREGERLKDRLTTFTGHGKPSLSSPLLTPSTTSHEDCSSLREKEAILQFLALLAGDITEQPSPEVTAHNVPCCDNISPPLSQQIFNSSGDSGVFSYDEYPRYAWSPAGIYL